MSDYKNKFLAHYKGTREKYERLDIMSTIQSYNSPVSGNGSLGSPYRARSNSQPTGVAKIMAGLAEIGMSGVKPEELPRLFPSDSMEPALLIMAEVRAYFQGNLVKFFMEIFYSWSCSVAYKRFADIIPLAIDVELVRGVERNVLKELYLKLGVNGDDGARICRELAQESPQVADKRADLLKKLERLEIASAQLLHMTYT